MNPKEAFEHLTSMPPGTDIYTLSAELELPVALLYEWSQAFFWETRLIAHTDADPQMFKLRALTDHTLALTNTMLRGGGVVELGGFVPRRLSVPAIKLDGTTQALSALTATLSRLVDKAAPLAGQARQEALENDPYAGHSDMDLAREVIRQEERQ